LYRIRQKKQFKKHRQTEPVFQSPPWYELKALPSVSTTTTPQWEHYSIQESEPRIQLFIGRNKDRSCPRELVSFVAGKKQREGEIM